MNLVMAARCGSFPLRLSKGWGDETNRVSSGLQLEPPGKYYLLNVRLTMMKFQWELTIISTR